MAWDENKWKKKFQSFALSLKGQEQEEGKIEPCCKICGRSRIPLFYDDGIPVCINCRDNRISRLEDAAGILYLAYGNFSRMFKVGFRYPNLFFLETEEISIDQLDSRRENYHGLVASTGRSGYDFTLGIVRNIPSAFLEEIFVFSFSRMYLKERIEKWGREKDVLGTPVSFSWDDAYQDPEELMRAVQKSLINGEELTVEEPQKEKEKEDGENEEEVHEEGQEQREQSERVGYTEMNYERAKCEKAIMVCYLYDNGRKEQADILKERFFLLS